MTIHDALAVLGLASMVGGVGMLSIPAALVLFGVLLLAAGILPKLRRPAPRKKGAR